MALTGTLRDFGIAEILQLIGQQAKNGVLHLRRRDEEIHVALADGRVVSAEFTGRKQRDRIGSMLVRAGLLAQGDLDRALAEQSRTLRRLGDILAEHGLVSRDDLRQMSALQTSETLYQLFGWKSGTYRFEPGAVEYDAAAVAPIRLEAVLMEGFRQVDEWPMIRRKITSPEMTFRPRAALPRAEPEPAGEEDFGEGGGGIGPDERCVYALAEAGRTVDEIADRSRLGQFAASKALVTLVNLGLLEPVPPPRRSAAAGVTAYARTWRDRLRRGAATVALAALLAVTAWLAADRTLAAGDRAGKAVDGAVARRLVARGQLSRLGGALEVWRLEHGAYPDRLQPLVEARLVEAADLRRPWGEEYHYRRRAEGFVLLPPLP